MPGLHVLFAHLKDGDNHSVLSWGCCEHRMRADACELFGPVPDTWYLVQVSAAAALWHVMDKDFRTLESKGQVFKKKFI